MWTFDAIVALACTGGLGLTLLFGGHGGGFVWMIWLGGWEAFLVPNLLSAAFLAVLWGGLLVRDEPTWALTRVLAAQLGGIAWFGYLYVINDDDGMGSLLLLALFYAATLSLPFTVGLGVLAVSGWRGVRA